MTKMTQSTPNPQIQPTDPASPAPLSAEAIGRLSSQGCVATDWARVKIAPGTDLSLIRNVEFEGDVAIGLLDRSRYERCMVSDALLRDSTLGNGVRVRHVAGGISGATIGDEAVIENTARIHYDLDPDCAVGRRIGVLDETGAREVVIYPGLSAQSALLMARSRRIVAEEIYTQTQEYIDSLHLSRGIGTRAVIQDCGTLHNVSVDPDVRIEGATALSNGSIFNNADSGNPAIAYVGHGVNADSFIIEDAIVDAGVTLRNCYVGQGVKLEKGFTAHDSLFFANSQFENGEACAVFAGPYTVSMHKGTLLIGCQTSFMNAGSSTNQSNHMYKLGPVHWGVLERGVKTSSGSYLMLGANIGAFSLLMGQHKTHPDSREFPFSYLFGDPQGATVVVPAVMLRSCGLLRDELKWPSRDRRVTLRRPLHDKVIFDVLTPPTVDAMIEALNIIRPMLSPPADDDHYHRYKGMKLSRASLDRAMKLYHLGIMKYLSLVLRPEEGDADWQFPARPDDAQTLVLDGSPWADVAGLPMPRPLLEQACRAESVEAREQIFREAFSDYETLQRRWIAARFPDTLRCSAADIIHGAREFDRLVELDRTTYRDSLSAELAMLAL